LVSTERALGLEELGLNKNNQTGFCPSKRPEKRKKPGGIKKKKEINWVKIRLGDGNYQGKGTGTANQDEGRGG